LETENSNLTQSLEDRKAKIEKLQKTSNQTQQEVEELKKDRENLRQLRQQYQELHQSSINQRDRAPQSKLVTIGGTTVILLATVISTIFGIQAHLNRAGSFV